MSLRFQKLSNIKYLHIYLILYLFTTASIINAKTIYYVTATGTGDGSSWAKAANNIQTMIDKAVSGDEVWVAKGTYYPTTETIARDARSRTFSVKNGVNLYGGFAGSESLVSQRTLADLNLDGKIDSCELVNTTILSGDIDGVADVWTKTNTINTNGIPWSWTVTGNSGNCYHVVTAQSKIDGFSVIGGNTKGDSKSDGGGIYSNSSVINCTISNCSSSNYGGGIYSISSSVTNCYISNCSTSNYGGGGIYSIYSSVTNCTVSDCSAYSGGGIFAHGSTYTNSSVTNCTISNCSASSGGGINANPYSPLTNCIVSNCSAGSGGGGISVDANSSVTNCTVSNCSAFFGGGISANSYSIVANCAVFNCFSTSSGGGISAEANSTVTNCAFSNNSSNGTIGSGISGGAQCISPNVSVAYIQPTSFIGMATNDAQKLELKNASWHLKEGSPCINAGTSTNVSTTILTGKDFDNNPRVLYGTIDIGAYEYTIPKIQIPVSENYNNINSWDNSFVFYNSTQINGGQNNKWTLINQKAVFSWQTNLTTTYSQPIFTYQIDGAKSSKVYLRYDMYFQAYAGTISPLGTEKLNVEFSTDLVTWSNIATYSNASGTIANQAYKHDISTLAAGKTFFIRFNANGANSNRIEKWEIDNVIIDTNGLSAVNKVPEDKYNYSIKNGNLIISNLEVGAGVLLFDINGGLLKTIKSESNTAHLELPVKGAYLIKVSSVSGVENKKMVW